MERFTLDLGHVFFIQTRSIRPIMIFNRQIVRRGTLDGSLMALCGVTYTEFPDLTGLNSEITLVPIADLVHFHRRTDAGLRVKRLKEPSSSAELVLVCFRTFWTRSGTTGYRRILRSTKTIDFH